MAETSAGDGFFTASHCTDSLFSRSGDYTNMYQSLSTSSQNRIGAEYADPLIEPGQGCDADEGCRLSDAAFFLWDSQVYDSIVFGTIARTTGLGSTTFGSPERFTIGDEGFIYVGQTGYLMGQKSGWQEGEVLATCVNFPNYAPGIDLACQAAASYESNFGDSGGSVFTWDGSSGSVEFVGLHVGVGPVPVGYPPDTVQAAVFSKWPLVALEFESGPWND